MKSMAKKIAKELAKQNVSQLMKDIDMNVRKVIEVFRLIFKYRIIFRSKSVEFAGLREYTPEDDSSFIDWASFAKTGKLYAKVYEEEKDLDIVAMLDTSSSMLFGTQTMFKSDYARIVAGTLMHAGSEVGHRIGMSLFNSRAVSTIEPMQGNVQYYRIVREMATPENWGGRKNFSQAVSDFLLTFKNPRTSLFIISDFLDPGQGWEEKLRLLGYKYEKLFAVVVRDPRDEKLPKGVGLVSLTDPVTGKSIVVDPAEIGDEYEKRMRAFDSYLEKQVNLAGGKLVKVYTTDNFVKPLVKILTAYG